MNYTALAIRCFKPDTLKDSKDLNLVPVPTIWWFTILGVPFWGRGCYYLGDYIRGPIFAPILRKMKMPKSIFWLCAVARPIPLIISLSAFSCLPSRTYFAHPSNPNSHSLNSTRGLKKLCKTKERQGCTHRASGLGFGVARSEKLPASHGRSPATQRTQHRANLMPPPPPSPKKKKRTPTEICENVLNIIIHDKAPSPTPRSPFSPQSPTAQEKP